MYRLFLRSVWLIALASMFAGFTACTTGDNPDQIRQRTAEATATVKRDTKAIAEGVKEGLASQKTININKASRSDLLSLPGVTEHEADRIIADRPFENAHDLVRRRILSEAEYGKIRDRIIAGN